jgi:hypothetical protein
MKRYREGITGEGFFQKQAPKAEQPRDEGAEECGRLRAPRRSWSWMDSASAVKRHA